MRFAGTPKSLSDGARNGDRQKQPRRIEVVLSRIVDEPKVPAPRSRGVRENLVDSADLKVVVSPRLHADDEALRVRAPSQGSA